MEGTGALLLSPGSVGMIADSSKYPIAYDRHAVLAG
jgi:hypothetical protein